MRLVRIRPLEVVTWVMNDLRVCKGDSSLLSTTVSSLSARESRDVCHKPVLTPENVLKKACLITIAGLLYRGSQWHNETGSWGLLPHCAVCSSQRILVSRRLQLYRVVSSQLAASVAHVSAPIAAEHNQWFEGGWQSMQYAWVIGQRWFNTR